jgi:hypothetical protein
MALEPDVAEKLAFLGWRPRQPSDSIEPPWYGPVCPVVWEGRSREAPPYADQCDMGAIFFAQYLGASHRLCPSRRHSSPKLTSEGIFYRRFSHGWGRDPT